MVRMDYTAAFMAADCMVRMDYTAVFMAADYMEVDYMDMVAYMAP